MMQRPRFVPVQQDYFQFAGGLDLVTPPMVMKPGIARDSLNFECSVNGGYTLIEGYERFDGRDAPSAATYSILNVTISGAFAANDTITGVTSAATAVVVSVITSESPNYLVITKVSGTFNASETLNVGGSPQGTTTAAAASRGASTVALDASYLNLAADEYRDDIAAVPGSGNVLGVKTLGDVVYAWRANAGGTAVDIHKSTSSGWSAVALGRELVFTSGGATEITEGQTITGATSGATAVLTRVVLRSGTWAGGTAAGSFIFASQTGTFQAENIDVGASTNLATIAGDSSAITLSTGGRYEIIKRNFGGTVNTARLYGCDGANKAFEFDGTVYVPLTTGMTTDTPLHIWEHKNHLFLSFGASVQHSGTGTPYQYTIVTGASEIAMGDTVTGMISQPGDSTGGALLIATRNTLGVLYGSDASDWNLVTYSEEAGAFAYSLQQIGQAYMMDDRGITSLATTANFGNFEASTVSRLVRPFVNARKTRLDASCIVREKNQYRIFFNDKYALYITIFNRKIIGIMPVLLADTVECMCSDEFSDGSERIFFGSSDGVVYEMDKGTSLDGDAIEFYLHLAFNHSGSPQQLKHYRTNQLELSGSGYIAFSFSYELGYGSTDISQPGTQSGTTSFSSSTWDVGAWDSGFWDGSTLSPSRFKLEGSAENISIKIAGSGDSFSPVTFNGATNTFTPRRGLR